MKKHEAFYLANPWLSAICGTHAKPVIVEKAGHKYIATPENYPGYPAIGGTIAAAIEMTEFSFRYAQMDGAVPRKAGPKDANGAYNPPVSAANRNVPIKP